MKYQVRRGLFQQNLQNDNGKSKLYQMSGQRPHHHIRRSRPTPKKLYIWKTISCHYFCERKPPDNSVVVLNKFTTDQVHVFGRNMEVPGCFSKSKFLCHVAIAHHFDFHNRLGKYRLSPTAQANQTTSNLCRAINMVFSDSSMNGLKLSMTRKADMTMKPVTHTSTSGFVPLLLTRIDKTMMWYVMSMKSFMIHLILWQQSQQNLIQGRQMTNL